MVTSIEPVPSSVDRALGLAGILGGGVLLAAFLPTLVIPADVNNGRLLLYLFGAAAVTWALLRTGGVGSGRRARIVAGATIALTAASALVVLVASTREAPFAGTFGLVAFWLGLATWIASSALGLLLVRQPPPLGWGGLALAIGSALAILGMDRLGLTSEASPTIVGSIALTGIALNGLGWILLGIGLAVTPRQVAQGKAYRSSPGSQGFPSP